MAGRSARVAVEREAFNYRSCYDGSTTTRFTSSVSNVDRVAVVDLSATGAASMWARYQPITAATTAGGHVHRSDRRATARP
jgi:hypothetical protein